MKYIEKQLIENIGRPPSTSVYDFIASRRRFHLSIIVYKFPSFFEIKIAWRNDFAHVLRGSMVFIIDGTCRSAAPQKQDI